MYSACATRSVSRPAEEEVKMSRSLAFTIAAALGLATACTAQDTGPVGTTGTPLPGSAGGQATVGTGQPDLFAESLLQSHNAARSEVGVAPLRWNNVLAADAQRYAVLLAALNRIEHADDTERRGAGENLWMGSTGFYSTREIMNAFLLEKRIFRPGVFPDVSTTGNWTDVGHYTQIIWHETEEVGCAMANNRSNDFLVCRYLPAGNFRGVRIPQANAGG